MLNKKEILELKLNPEAVEWAWDSIQDRLNDEMDTKEKIEVRSVGLVRTFLSASTASFVLSFTPILESVSKNGLSTAGAYFSLATALAMIAQWGHPYPDRGGSAKDILQKGFLDGDVPAIKAVRIGVVDRAIQIAKDSNRKRRRLNRAAIISGILGVASLAVFSLAA